MTSVERLSGLLLGDLDQWRALVPAETDALTEGAAREGVHLLLAWQLRQHPEERAACPPPVREALDAALLAEFATEHLRRDTLREVLSDLTAAGVEALVFKGSALAVSVYPDSAVRPRLDTDILIRPRDAVTAARVLTAHGFTAPVSITRELVAGAPDADAIAGFKASSQIDFSLDDAFGIHHEIDLHWQASIPQAFAAALRHDALFAEAVPLPQLGTGARGFGVPHALVMACIHRVAHHHGHGRLIWLYDIHLLAERLTPPEVDRVLGIAVDGRVAAVVAAGLADAGACFHTAFPPDLLPRLSAAAAADPTAPVVAFLAPRLRKIDVLKADWLALEGWPARLSLLRDHLFPPASYVLSRYGATNRALLPVLYAWRACSRAAGWFRTS